MVILLKGWILPFGGASLGRVCACSLRSRLVFNRCVNESIELQYSTQGILYRAGTTRQNKLCAAAPFSLSWCVFAFFMKYKSMFGQSMTNNHITK